MPIYSTQIVRLDGLMLAASVEDQQSTGEINEVKSQQRQIIRRMTNTSEPRAAIETGNHKLHYYRHEDIVFFAITERAFPKELATIYLDDIAAEFLNTHRDTEYRSATLRPYAFNDFDTFIQRTKKSYENPRASDNLDKVQAQLKETTQIMSKNLEDLLYRGDSLEKMSTMSSDLRDASKKYRKAAVRINWQLLLQQYGPFAALGFIILFFLVWRFW
ncbi:snare-like protein [Myriangium duriaei CBS 260.36]|uniref:Protein transport protein SEC22 n=1 Tax=Myriangium duriaei CBS 260.36 TaxID=1168546 RepID=A0A9P4JC22_9PEZI|nr:snare-like protein [Myriangium duriaei CBS 260.36]